MAKTDALRALLPGVTGGADTAPLFGGEALELRFGDSPPVNLEINPLETLTLYSFLATVPLGDAAARRFLVNVLELNQPGFLDCGAFFTVHEDSVAVAAVLEYEGMTPAGFKEWLERFAAQADELRGELIAVQHLADRENPDGPPMSDLFDDDTPGEGASPFGEGQPDMRNSGWLSV